MNYHTMHYVSLPNINGAECSRIPAMYTEYRNWLETHAGNENIAWKWDRGDLCAIGVYIALPDIATLFKLKFGA